MKITDIELYNFGSYEGRCRFNKLGGDDEKRIVIIGGKNGAGKTTLFTAIQLCLYGHYAFGYKSAGYHYFKELYNCINYNARLKENEKTYVKVSFQHASAREMSRYKITRQWTWKDGNIKEELQVVQDGKILDENDLSDFQSYLMHLIPPDMLKLYFFDGEKIADYFLSDNKINIKDALMVLSGNDTFEILHDKVQRVLTLNKGNDSSEEADNYFNLQRQLDTLNNELATLEETTEELQHSIADEEDTLEHLKNDYASSGGITLDALNKLQLSLQSEEDKRSKINSECKTIATDVLPFVILSDLVSEIKPQIMLEDEFNTNEVLKEKLSDSKFRDTLEKALTENGISSQESQNNIMEQVKSSLLSDKWRDFEPILQLSNDEKIKVYSIIDRVSGYDQNTIEKLQDQLKQSLNKTKAIRKKLQNSDAEHIENYIRDTTKIEGEINLLKVKKEQTDESITETKNKIDIVNHDLSNARKKYEGVIKKSSVSSLSGRVILLLEDLQKDVYAELINKVEHDLKLKLKQLMHKEDFFDDIIIDNSFNVHILRNDNIDVNDLIQMVSSGGQSALRRNIGDIAVDKLTEEFDLKSNAAIIKFLKTYPFVEINLPVEVKKESMSSGEKQIFVMSLYWALMNQSCNELPFIIDTPFARIDTEHRANITKYFFLDLTGQLFILSTDEEIRDAHIKEMEDQVSSVYMLECGEDKRTRILQDSFF